ncbi:MAG: DUF2070 family protein [Candidatus Nanosalina sp.]
MRRIPADNLEVFKKVIFRLPDLRATLLLLLVSGTVYSLTLSYLLKELFLEISLLIFVPVLSLSFILPSIASSELYSFFLPQYPRKWGYFLSLVNQLIIFLFALLLTITESFFTAWQVIWLALTTLFINNFFILVLSTGPHYLKRVSLLSMVQPLLILTGFHLVLGRYLQIGLVAYLSNFLIVLGAGFVLFLAIYLTEFLVGSNVSDISMLNLVTALLQNRQEKLDLGRKVKPDVQTLKVWNSSGEKTFVAPWVHPGPLQGFGGGRITSYLIEKLNSEGEGFFLHVPSCHQMDPSDPGDSQKVYDAITEPEKWSEASKLFKKEYELGTFYGRRIGDKRIVYLEIEDYDDYEAAVFREAIDPEETLLVDLHNQGKDEKLDEMRYGTRDAEKVREDLEDFLEKLEKQETGRYSAGFATSLGDKPVAALVEEVDDQRTVFFGVEGNDASENLLKLRGEFGDEFDEVLLFTTDTHSSVHDLASSDQAGGEEVREVVEEAVDDLSEAEAGLTSRRSEEMKFLKDDYYGLIYTINILVRLLPIALVLLYLGLVVWLL